MRLSLAVVLLGFSATAPAGNFSSFDNTKQVLIEDPLRADFIGASVPPEKLRPAIAAAAAAKGWTIHRGNETSERALGNCNRRANGACRLYAVDKTVVWSRE
jgi:hypothetical protein